MKAHIANNLENMRVEKMLRDACTEAGGQSAWAEKNGLSSQYVCDVAKGRRAPGKAILDALGLEKMVIYREKT